MNTRTPIGDIENELKKLFVSLGSIKAVGVAFILSKLDLSFIEIEQRDSKFSPESFVKLYIFKAIKGFNTYNILIKYLSNKVEEALQLGFYKDENNQIVLPKKQSLNRFFREKISKEKKIELNNITALILKYICDQKLILDTELVRKVWGENKENKSKYEEKKKVSEEALKLTKKLVYPEIDLKIGKNAKFTNKDFLDVLSYIAKTKRFTTGGAEDYQENNNKDTPNGDLLLHHFSKFKSVEEIKEIFDKVSDKLLLFAKQNYRLFNERKINIAYDVHLNCYYGNKNDKNVISSKYEKGTTNFHGFLACICVIAGRRVFLDVMPVFNLDSNLDNLLDESLTRVKKRIKINNVRINFGLFDRQFDRVKVIEILKKHKIKFIMPETRRKTVKAWMRKSEGCNSRLIKDFKIGKGENSTSVYLYLVNDEEGTKRAFITNFYIPEQLAHYLFRFYSKRWGVETAFRILDLDLKARTTSKNYNLRLFYFLFSICLYNLWVLVNVCVSLAIYGRIIKKPLIKVTTFVSILLKTAFDEPLT